MFQRSSKSRHSSNHDYRLNRVRSSGHLPLEVWAHWVVTRPRFNFAILLLVIINSVVLGFSNELSRDEYPNVFNVFDLLDLSSLIFFSLEIALHWLDNFPLFWRSHWNCFDFVVTLMSAIPTLLSFLDIGNGNISKLAGQLRIFRIFRSLKVVSRFRNLRLIITTMYGRFVMFMTL